MSALMPKHADEVRAIVAEMIGQALRDMSAALNADRGARLRCLELAVQQQGRHPAETCALANAFLTYVEGRSNG